MQFRHWTIPSSTIRIIAWTIIGIALAIGLVTRPIAVFRYVGFDNDQAWNAGKMMELRHGTWLSYGPYSSVGGYSLPPLYFYATAPFTLFGTNPAWQGFGNAVYSFLAIPLLMLLLFLLLEKIPREYRLLLAGLGGVWWSMFFWDIDLNTIEWNPSIIPFFLLLGALLYYWQSRSTSAKKQWPVWVASGIVLAVFANLHSSTLFIAPIVFILTALYFIWKHRRFWYMPMVALVVATILMAPYWKAEVRDGWYNSGLIISTVDTSAQEQHTALQKVDRATFNYLELGALAYFPSWNVASLPNLFLAAILIAALFLFRGNKTLFGFLGVTWIVASYAAANYWHTFFIHYKTLFWCTPIIFAMIALAYLPWTNWKGKIGGALIVLFMVLSVASNWTYVHYLLSARFGVDRLVTVQDELTALRDVPQASTVCTPRLRERSYGYYDAQILHKNFSFTADCNHGAYQIIPRCVDGSVYHQPIVCADPTLPVGATIISQAAQYVLVQR